MEVLVEDLKLLIDDFGSKPPLRDAVKGYYHLLRDYNQKRGHELLVLHRRGMYVGI